MRLFSYANGKILAGGDVKKIADNENVRLLRLGSANGGPFEEMTLEGQAIWRIFKPDSENRNLQRFGGSQIHSSHFFCKSGETFKFSRQSKLESSPVEIEKNSTGEKYDSSICKKKK